MQVHPVNHRPRLAGSSQLWRLEPALGGSGGRPGGLVAEASRQESPDCGDPPMSWPDLPIESLFWTGLHVTG